MNSNKQIVETLDEFVAGHAEAKKALAVLLTRSKLRSYQRHVKLMDDEFLVSPMKILLVGASGTGKTHLVDTLQRIACFPLVKIDATDLNPTGASGGIKSDKLKKMIVDEAYEMHQRFPHLYPEAVQALAQSVVYIDEIDKLGTTFESSGNWNKHVQSNFLTLFDNKDAFADVSFIFSGAFAAITGPKEEKTNTSIGFTNAEGGKKAKITLDEQILQAGIIPELLGRINMVVELDKFTKDDYIKMINERLLPKKLRDLACYGVFDPKISCETIEDVAEKAIISGQGVRFAQRELDKIFLDVEYEAYWDEPLHKEEIFFIGDAISE